jgi:hypothetical protein
MPSLRRTPAEAAVLIEALTVCTVASILVRTVRFSRLAQRLGRHMQETPASQPGATGQPVRRVRWAVRVAARLLPWKPLCFPQAITAQWMLRRRGIPSTLYFGTRPGAAYEAHAWVRVGGVIVTGGDDPTHFTVVSTFA